MCLCVCVCVGGRGGGGGGGGGGGQWEENNLTVVNRVYMKPASDD